VEALRPIRIPFHAMGSACELVLCGTGGAQLEPFARAAIDEVLRIEAKYSRYRSDSVLSTINSGAARKAVEIDFETLALLRYAQELYRSSEGLFDITSGVLRRAWDFVSARLPAPGELEALLPLVGWPQVEVQEHRHGSQDVYTDVTGGEDVDGAVERQGGSVFLPHAGMELDFGGFGKEYATDRAWGVLHGMGMEHGYVNLAGDMRFLGPKPDGTPWMIGIQHPRQSGALLATIPVSDGALATSGDYEKHFEANGQRYCHILDPRTGMPVTHWRTVSVVAPLAAMAGSLTTTAMLLQERGLAILHASDVKFLAMDKDGALFTHND